MALEGQNLIPTREWLRAQLALMDGCCLDNPEDVNRVADHLFGNWVMVERSVTWELAAALELVSDWMKDRETSGYFDRPFAVVKTTLARYKKMREEEMQP